MVPSRVLALFSPRVGKALVELEFRGPNCVLKGVLIKMEGEVLGRVPTVNEENVISGTNFEVVNPSSNEVRQKATEWESETTGMGESATGVELRLVEGAMSSPMALESIEQFELSRVNNKRDLYGVRTK
jgi:hypothetical protein